MNDDNLNDAEKKLPPLHPTYEALRKMRPAAAASDDQRVKDALAEIEKHVRDGDFEIVLKKLDKDDVHGWLFYFYPPNRINPGKIEGPPDVAYFGKDLEEILRKYAEEGGIEGRMRRREAMIGVEWKGID